MNIHELFPADDLHWCEEQKSYVVLSKRKTRKIFSLCGDLDEKQAVAVAMEYQKYLISHLIWKNVLSGRITVDGVDDNGELLFSPKKP